MTDVQLFNDIIEKIDQISPYQKNFLIKQVKEFLYHDVKLKIEEEEKRWLSSF